MRPGDYIRFTKFRGVTFDPPLWGICKGCHQGDPRVDLLVGPSFMLSSAPRFTVPSIGWSLNHPTYKGLEYTVYSPDGDLHDFYAVQAMQTMGLLEPAN
jgi:hypothetical protein